MTRKELNRLGVLGATSYVVGSVIGSGIFVSPKGILQNAGSVGLSLIIWVLAALLASLTAINYIELGTSIPESGAEFAYIRFVGWTPIAFSYLWLASLIQSSCSGASLALTFGEYIVQSIAPITCLNSHDSKIAAILLAHSILLATSLLNMFSLRRFAGRIQFVSMVAKLTAVLAVIVIGFFYMILRGQTQHFNRDFIFEGSGWSPTQIVLALYQGNWAYAGYTILNYGMEDIQIKNFQRTVPRAVLFGLFASAFVYVMANVAYFTVLTPQQILESSAVATTFAQKTVGPLSYAMPALIALLMVGSVNAEIFAWSRFMSAGSRRGMMPSALSLVHPENDSPRVAVFTHTTLAMAFCLVGDIYLLVNYLTVTALAATTFSVGALVFIKWKKIPVSEDAVKFPIYLPILNFIISLALLLIPVVVEPIKSGVGFGLFILGITGYYLFQRPAKKPDVLLKIDSLITYVCQQIFWTVPDSAPSYKKVNSDIIDAGPNSRTEQGDVKVLISTVSGRLSTRRTHRNGATVQPGDAAPVNFQ